MQWSAQQQAIFAAVANGSGHLVVQARAGTGKTTTIVEALRYVPRGADVLLVAFNKEVKEELARRAPAGVRVATFHSLGLSAISQRRGRPEIEKRKGVTIAREVLRERAGEIVRQSGKQRWQPEAYAYEVAQLAGHGKNTHVRSIEALEQLAIRHGLVSKLVSPRVMAEAAAECMRRAAQRPKTVDFDDMLYLPAKLGLTPPLADYVFIDELQDLSPAQLWLACATCTPGGRIVAVGDPMQGIYSWRDAAADTVERTIEALSATVLPLSTTYRCAKDIVDFVKRKVTGLDDFGAAPGAPAGEVRKMVWEDATGPFGAQPGDFIISRLNAPLMPLALHFMRHNVPCVVAGRDIGDGLTRILEDARASRLDELVPKLLARRQVEYAELVKADEPEAAEARFDQFSALLELARAASDYRELETTLHGLFSDKTPDGRIVCTTVHRAKGLERDRVFLLTGTFRNYNNDIGGEESRLFYVACTRAKRSLTLVGPGPDDRPPT